MKHSNFALRQFILEVIIHSLYADVRVHNVSSAEFNPSTTKCKEIQRINSKLLNVKSRSLEYISRRTNKEESMVAGVGAVGGGSGGRGGCRVQSAPTLPLPLCNLYISSAHKGNARSLQALTELTCPQRLGKHHLY